MLKKKKKVKNAAIQSELNTEKPLGRVGTLLGQYEIMVNLA